MGSDQFLALVLLLWGTAHLLIPLLSYAMRFYLVDVFGSTAAAWSGYESCAVGFSAVLFGLKAVLHARSPGPTRVNFPSLFGGLGYWGAHPGSSINVPAQWAAWVELFISSAFNPSASFVGHLAGIVAGIVYVQLETPLRAVVSTGRETLLTLLGLKIGRSSSSSSSSGRAGRPRFYGSGTTGYRQ